jgi:hypothetical protein
MSLHKILLLFPLVGLVSCTSSPARTASPKPNLHAGGFRVAGDLGYSSNGNGTMNGKSVHMDGKLGYLVTDILEVGASLGYESVNRENTADLDATFLSLYGRAYSTNAGPFRTFAEIGFGTGTATVGGSDADVNLISIAVGMMEFMTDDIAVELSLEDTFYGFSSPAVDGNGLALNLGVSWYL